MPITIDTAGLHPTTESCLEALQWLEQRPFRRVLDLGCGNGILSLATAGIWNADVLAADISQAAVDDTTRNSKEHQLDSLITAIRSDGFTHPLIRERAPYDLIIFNMLAEPIVQMAPQVRAHIAGDGICILSGILAWMAADVEAVYARLGFKPLRSLSRSPWQTYIMESVRHP